MSRIDLVIFGATGFTGKYTVKNLVHVLKSTKSKLTWGVAGRNKEKLLKTLSEMALEEDVSDIPIIIADVEDEDSLNEMAKQAKVILNCCGPYRFYGEPVVKACINNNTHHVDVSGEPEYMEKIQVEYHEKAKQNQVFVVSACGFDSIPADLGLVYLKEKFEGEVNSAEIFLSSWNCSERNYEGSSIHYGTWESAVYGLASQGSLKDLRKQLFPENLPSLKPKLQSRSALSKCDELGKWCLPFPGSDRSVIKRSQYYFYQTYKQRPIQVGCYIAFPNIFVAIFVAFMAVIFGILAKINLGRNILLKYPKLFSCGFASHEGPSEEKADNTCFALTFCGEGWKEKLSEGTDNHKELPNKKIVTRVSGKNPGYGATCILLIMSGLTILEEARKMPNNGGVYPPGAAFEKTNLISRLSEFGVKFEVLSTKEN